MITHTPPLSALRAPSLESVLRTPAEVGGGSGTLAAAGGSADAKQVANQFEALFLFQLLQPLEESAAFFGEGVAGRTVAGLFREQLADKIATTRPLGIAREIEAALTQRGAAAAAYKKGTHDNT